MNVHENARLTAHSRAELVRRVVDQGQPRKVVAAAFGVDPKTRIAFSQILPDEKASSAVPFLKAAIDYYAGLGVTVTRVMTDNGSCYKAFAFRDACKALGLRHIRTKPYTPKTNGKAERFIQTALREWAYAQKYQSSDRRAAELPFWLHRYNGHRPTAASNYKHPSADSPSPRTTS